MMHICPKNIKGLLYQNPGVVQMVNGMRVLGLLEFVYSWRAREGRLSNQQASLANSRIFQVAIT